MFNREVEVLWVSRYDYNSGSSLRLHNHQYYQIIYILDGDVKFYLNDQCYEQHSQSLFIMKPGDEHGLSTNNSTKVKTLDIKFMIHQVELEQKLLKLPDHLILNDDEIISLFEKIRKEGLEKNCYFKEFSSVYLLEILLVLLRQNETQDLSKTHKEIHIPDEHISACQKIKEYLEINFMNQVSLEDISRALGYNKSYICQVFKKYGKVSVMQYLYNYRIKKVTELLSYSDYSLKEIADLTGFKTIHHFSRRFHTMEGITPGAYRERERKGIRKDIVVEENFLHDIHYVTKNTQKFCK